MKTFLFNLILIITLFSMLRPAYSFEDSAEDIDVLYQKQGDEHWGDIYARSFDNPKFGKCYALVIGVGKYRHGFTNLESAYHDAIRVRDFLIQQAQFDYVVTLTNDKATKKKIEKLMVDTFPEILKKNDRFLFYFSGHGSQRKIDEARFGYLVLGHSHKTSYSEMITMQDVERWDNLLRRVRQVLFVLDSCFSGLAGFQRKSPLVEKKMERLSQRAHHLITAGTANEISVANLQKWHGSLFTDSFLRAASGLGDSSSTGYKPDGVVSLKELMEYIGNRIDDESTRLKKYQPLRKSIKMSPQISDLRDNEGEFFFITKEFTNPEAENHPSSPAEGVSAKIDTTEKKDDTFTEQAIGTSTDDPSAQSIPGSFVPPILSKNRLRGVPRQLSEAEVKKMVIDRSYFDIRWNRIGISSHDYEDNGDGTVTDRSSGLTWQRGGSPAPMNWVSAKSYVKMLNQKRFAGLYGWRLPTMEELASLIQGTKQKGLYIKNLFDDLQSYCWSSDYKDQDVPWVANFAHGVIFQNAADKKCFVKAVCAHP